MRSFKKQEIRNWTLTGLTLLTPMVVYGASQVGDNGLYIFAPNTKIISAEVNENFVQIDDRLGVYEDAIAVSNGLLGIGTKNPSAMLTVQGSYAYPQAIFGYDAANGNGLRIRADGSSTHYNWQIDQQGSAGGLNFVPSTLPGGSTFDSPLMTLRETGNVGIGTESPGDQLSVVGASTTRISVHNTNRSVGQYADISFGTGSVNSNYFLGHLRAIVQAVSPLQSSLHFYVNSGDSALRALSIRENGNVGIGLTSPGYPLDVNGQVRASNVSVTSDARLKRDIQPLTHALEGIQCLQGVSYYLRDPQASQELQLGLIAQEVERCYPELVSTDPEGYKSVSYDRLVAPLIEAVKEQQQLIARQQQRLQAQEQVLQTQQQLSAGLEVRLARIEGLLNQGK